MRLSGQGRSSSFRLLIARRAATKPVKLELRWGYGSGSNTRYSLSLRFGLRSRLRFGREREVRSNRKCTRVEKPEVIGNALPAQKPEAQAEGMRVVACKRPAVRLVGAANVCHQNVDLGLPCPTASNKPHGRTPRDRLTTCPLACPSRVADAAWQRRHGRTRANSRPPPAPPR